VDDMNVEEPESPSDIAEFTALYPLPLRALICT
jgi:hypothetical protein